MSLDILLPEAALARGRGLAAPMEKPASGVSSRDFKNYEGKEHAFVRDCFKMRRTHGNCVPEPHKRRLRAFSFLQELMFREFQYLIIRRVIIIIMLAYCYCAAYTRMKVNESSTNCARR